MVRLPDRFAENPPERRRKKWERIILSFMQGDLDTLRSIQRTGARGRILFALVEEMLHVLGISYRPEPIFDHMPPNLWYVQFAQKHDLKLRTNSFYNPDFILKDGAWLEVTLSENSAYKKLFRYGHQAEELIVVCLDEDQGLHKSVCQRVAFPNARVERVQRFYDELRVNGGEELVRKLDMLKELKGIAL